jgi:hypothetical protein
MVTRLGECVIVYFGQFYENDKSGPHFWATFLPRLRLCINFDKNLLGYILGDFFPKTHLVTLTASQLKLYFCKVFGNRDRKRSHRHHLNLWFQNSPRPLSPQLAKLMLLAVPSLPSLRPPP